MLIGRGITLQSEGTFLNKKVYIYKRTLFVSCVPWKSHPQFSQNSLRSPSSPPPQNPCKTVTLKNPRTMSRLIYRNHLSRSSMLTTAARTHLLPPLNKIPVSAKSRLCAPRNVHLNPDPLTLILNSNPTTSRPKPTSGTSLPTAQQSPISFVFWDDEGWAVLYGNGACSRCQHSVKNNPLDGTEGFWRLSMSALVPRQPFRSLPLDGKIGPDLLNKKLEARTFNGNIFNILCLYFVWIVVPF